MDKKDDEPIEFSPKRPIGRGQLPLGCDQQGQYPYVAEPCVDPDEIEAHKYVEPEPEPLWPKVLGVVIAIMLIGLVFGPVGAK
jgi:hypothetical protein